MKITAIKGLGSEILASMSDQATITATMDNTKQALKYARYCIKNREIAGDELEQYGLICLMREYKQLLTVKPLVEKYTELYKEGYYKLKHDCERLLKI